MASNLFVRVTVYNIYVFIYMYNIYVFIVSPFPLPRNQESTYRGEATASMNTV